MPNITMTYRDYSFIPVPLLNITKEFQKTDDGTPVGTVFSASLEGTLTPLPTGSIGYISVDELQDSLRSGLAEEGHRFLVQCDSTTLIEAYPRITNVEFAQSNNNWVMTCPYTINLEWDDEPNTSGENSSLMPPYISSASEEWSIAFVEDHNCFSWTLNDPSSTVDAAPYVLQVTHNISAVGKRHYGADTGNDGILDKAAWQQAQAYVTPRLGLNTDRVVQTGVLNLDADVFGYFNHIRTVNIGELGGSYGVEEKWIAFGSGISGVPGNAHEDFTVEIRESSEDGLISVGIQGTINGLETRTYGTNSGDFAITQCKYDAALNYWNQVKTRLYWRAEKALENTTTSSRGLHITPLTNSVGHAPSAGNITYNYEYNDRACNLISGAKFESIQITENHPTDIFASLVIPGRAYGPILQTLSTVGAGSKTISIECVMNPPSGDCANCSSQLSSLLSMSNAPTGQVATILCCLQTELTDAYSQVLKTEDTSSWNPKTGRYSRNVGWTYTNCSGSPPNSSFC